MPIVSQYSMGLQIVTDWHGNIHQYQVDSVFVIFIKLHGFFPVAGINHIIAFENQEFFEKITQVFFVINYENSSCLLCS